MNRREILKNTSLAIGGALSIGTISAVMSGCKAEVDLGWIPNVLSTDQANLISEIAERIIPKTDTPGAKDIGIGSFIDNALNLNFGSDERSLFMKGLGLFDSIAKEKFSKSFVDISDEDKDAVLQQLADDAKANPREPSIFGSIKQLTVAGYFTSEQIAKEVLVYDPIPGEYKGCVSLKDVGGAYAF